jgi:signal transduction histidine kinase
MLSTLVSAALRQRLLVLLGSLALLLYGIFAARRIPLDVFPEFARPLVEVLLTLARSDAGELPVRKQRVDLDALLAQIAEPYYAVAAERHIEVAIMPRSRDVAPLWLYTDPLLLGRALSNLLDNACKFTPEGGHVTLRGDRTAAGVEISITDDGPGLCGDAAQRAFERFFRGTEHRGSTLGFGLGLPLTLEFSRALGGTVELQNNTAAGTRAVLRLPD